MNLSDKMKAGAALALGGLCGITLSECAKESGANTLLADAMIVVAGWIIAMKWTFFGLGITGIALGRLTLQIVEGERESAFRCPLRLLWNRIR